MSNLTTRITAILIAIAVALGGLIAAPAAHAAPKPAKTCSDVLKTYETAGKGSGVRDLNLNIGLCWTGSTARIDQLVKNWGDVSIVLHNKKSTTQQKDKAKLTVARDWAALLTSLTPRDANQLTGYVQYKVDALSKDTVTLHYALMLNFATYEMKKGAAIDALYKVIRAAHKVSKKVPVTKSVKPYLDILVKSEKTTIRIAQQKNRDLLHGYLVDWT